MYFVSAHAQATSDVPGTETSVIHLQRLDAMLDERANRWTRLGQRKQKALVVAGMITFVVAAFGTALYFTADSSIGQLASTLRSIFL